MNTQTQIHELRQKCGKIRRCIKTIPASDLGGKYQRSYRALQDEAARAANNCLRAAMFSGMHCWDPDPEILDTTVNGFLESLWFREGAEEASRALGRGDDQAVLQWLYAVRLRFRDELQQISSTEAGYIEDGEEFQVWHNMISELTTQ